MALVKVTLVTNGASEIRRFQMNSDTFSSLNEQLKNIFSVLNETDYIITWTDGDGDDIRITNDGELWDAISENSDKPPLKIKVKANKKACSASVKTEGECHNNVLCDGCNGNVKGFRYKCIQCPDYDLCADCEAKGLHPGHNMIRFVQPMPCQFPWRLFMRRCNRWFPTDGDWSMPFYMRRKHSGWKRRCHQEESCERNNDKEKDNEMSGSSESSGVEEDGPTENKKKSRDSEKPRMYPSVPPFLNFGAIFDHPGGESQRQTWHNFMSGLSGAGNSSDYLRNVGERVVSFLDPMGIDVHVDVETNGNRHCMKKNKKKGGRCCQKRNSCSGGCKKQASEEKAMEEDTGTNNKTPQETAPEEQVTEGVASMHIDQETRGESPVTEGDKDFVIVPQPETEQQTPTAPVTDTPTPAPQEIAPAPEETAPAPPHPDPKVAKALNQLLAMGFSNEGGWLTQLLEVKEGDIGRVLDVLLPVGMNKQH